MALLAASLALLTACAGLPPPPPTTPAAAPEAWQAPLPHGGQGADLARWWQQFDDPLLSLLIEEAQKVSPSVASARARIEQARATRVASGAALGPTLDASASVVRGRQDFLAPIGTTASAGLQAGWELDLFGGGRAARTAAQARLDGAEAGWHEARVSVAAEVAQAYVRLRACEALLVQSQSDALSRSETARLTELSTQAGFQSPANLALARASAAQAQTGLTQQRTQCDLEVKALVALSGLTETAFRIQLGATPGALPQPAQLTVAQVPAAVLAQRPDVFNAERELVAASADVSEQQALRYPRVSLGGSLSAARFESGVGTSDGTLWSVGPVTVSLPLFDGGTRRANVVAARARYDAAAVAYAAQLRGAVREVEEALVTLQGTAERSTHAEIAAQGFEQAFRATEARYRTGLGSLFELEDARRSAVLAQNGLIELQRERVGAWITLYRALGGGWSSPAAAVPPAP